LPTLGPKGFGGFGPGGSWFWSPPVATTSRNVAPIKLEPEPSLLDCLEPWALSSDGIESDVIVATPKENDLVAATTALQRSNTESTGEGDPSCGSEKDLVSHAMNVIAITENERDRSCSIHWRIDSRRLVSKDKKAVSPSFAIKLEGRILGSFRMILTPRTVSRERNGSCFRRAKGWGVVEVKSESGEGEALEPLVMQATLLTGGDFKEALRKRESGFVTHNFSETCVCAVSEEWDFSAAVGEATQSFIVRLEVFAER